MSSGVSEALVRVFGMGREERGLMFLIMEFVEGKRLGGTLFSEQAAVKSVVDFCLELEKIDPSDPVLRWFECSDVMVAPGGKLLLVDHPILRVENHIALDGRQHHGPHQDVSMASPEAMQGKKTTPSSFVYSLACLVVFLCKMRGPFVGRNLVETASQHISAQPQLSLANDQLRAVLLSCLEKDPRRRPFSSIPEFRQAIAAAAL